MFMSGSYSEESTTIGATNEGLKPFNPDELKKLTPNLRKRQIESLIISGVIKKVS